MAMKIIKKNTMVFDTIMDFTDLMESDNLDIPMMDYQNVEADFWGNPLHRKHFDTRADLYNLSQTLLYCIRGIVPKAMSFKVSNDASTRNTMSTNSPEGSQYVKGVCNCIKPMPKKVDEQFENCNVAATPPEENDVRNCTMFGIVYPDYASENILVEYMVSITPCSDSESI